MFEKILKLNEDDLDIVLGRWDFTIDAAIKEVKKGIHEGKDKVDEILKRRRQDEEDKLSYCENGHRNEKPRGNQKYCRTCKSPLIDVEPKDNGNLDEIDDSECFNVPYKKLKVMDN